MTNVLLEFEWTKLRYLLCFCRHGNGPHLPFETNGIKNIDSLFKERAVGIILAVHILTKYDMPVFMEINY